MQMPVYRKITGQVRQQRSVCELEEQPEREEIVDGHRPRWLAVSLLADGRMILVAPMTIE
jgi:hypothetical protein